MKKLDNWSFMFCLLEYAIEKSYAFEKKASQNLRISLQWQK